MFAPLLLAAALGSDAQLVLDIRAKAIYPDDKSFAWAGDSNVESVASYIYIVPTGCGLGASNNEPTGPVSAGWHVTGRVLQRTADSLLARIEWERLWDQSQRLTGGSKKSMEVWIRAGDSLPLDEIASTPTPPCRAQGARLEATVTDQVIGPPAAHMTGAVGAGPIGRGTGGGGGGVRVGGAAAAGGVASSGGSVSSGGGAASGSGGSASSGGGAASGGGPASGGGAGASATLGPGIASILPVDLDVWLVHTRADGSEDTQHQRVSGGEGSFSFGAISIGTAKGDASVRVEGGMRAVVDVSGERQLRVSVRRDVTGAATSKGVSLSAYQLPGPDDVYAIELPALNVKGEAVKADRVSIRVRLAK